MGYFDDFANTIRLPTQKLVNAGNGELASIFLHEAEHAGQFYAPALNFWGLTIRPLDWARRFSSWLIPETAGEARQIVIFSLYALNPTEHLAATGGGFFTGNNFALGIVPRAVEFTLAIAHDNFAYSRPLYRYFNPSSTK